MDQVRCIKRQEKIKWRETEGEKRARKGQEEEVTKTEKEQQRGRALLKSIILFI